MLATGNSDVLVAALCDLHYKRMQVCNGQISWQGLCADRNCLYALEAAADAATTCSFANIPSEDLLCGAADGEKTLGLDACSRASFAWPHLTTYWYCWL